MRVIRTVVAATGTTMEVEFRGDPQTVHVIVFTVKDVPVCWASSSKAERRVLRIDAALAGDVPDTRAMDTLDAFLSRHAAANERASRARSSSSASPGVASTAPAHTETTPMLAPPPVGLVYGPDVRAFAVRRMRGLLGHARMGNDGFHALAFALFVNGVSPHVLHRWVELEADNYVTGFYNPYPLYERTFVASTYSLYDRETAKVVELMLRHKELLWAAHNRASRSHRQQPAETEVPAEADPGSMSRKRQHAETELPDETEMPTEADPRSTSRKRRRAEPESPAVKRAAVDYFGDGDGPTVGPLVGGSIDRDTLRAFIEEARIQGRQDVTSALTRAAFVCEMQRWIALQSAMHERSGRFADAQYDAHARDVDILPDFPELCEEGGRPYDGSVLPSRLQQAVEDERLPLCMNEYVQFYRGGAPGRPAPWHRNNKRWSFLAFCRTAFTTASMLTFFERQLTDPTVPRSERRERRFTIVREMRTRTSSIATCANRQAHHACPFNSFGNDAVQRCAQQLRVDADLVPSYPDPVRMMAASYQTARRLRLPNQPVPP